MGKKKNGPNLGRSIIRDRFSKTTGLGGGGSFLHTAELNDGYDWGRLNLQSVTEQNNLEDFLATAEMAGTEFTAEKLNVTFVSRDTYTGIPKGEELSKIKGLHKEHEDLLRIPRRPPWTKEMSASEVDHNEKMAFLDWRRSLALLQEVEGLVMTPYEKNLDFWRQLWRVIERSDVVVQIVDARNPLMFYCPDLVTYVREVDPTKQCVVLINKADYLTLPQREAWADYFSKVGIRCMFWSALEEAERLAAEESAGSDTEETSELTDDSDDDEEEEEEDMQECGKTDDLMTETEIAGNEMNTGVKQVSDKLKDVKLEKNSTDSSHRVSGVKHASADSETLGTTSDTSSPCTCTGDSPVTETDKSETGHKQATDGGKGSVTGRDSCGESETGACGGAGDGSSGSVHNTACVYTGQELLDILRSLHAHNSDREQLTTVGMVGYPNVGKSSTVNAILKMKKVPVSATPGRTKHFQTLFLDKTLMLCDCPGLVFPSFVTTKADLLVNGVLSIDHMRDHTPPISLICQRLPKHILEKTYGINIPLPGEGQDPDRPPTAQEMMNAYSAMRGFMTSSGIPDCPRGARIVLKDYVNGKLLFCQPPTGIDPTGFNVYPEPEAPPTAKGGGTEGGTATSSGPPVSKMDREFFNKDKSRVHTRTAQLGNADTGTGGGRMMEKTWKKHNNRRKKEKLRRVYAHLDKTD